MSRWLRTLCYSFLALMPVLVCPPAATAQELDVMEAPGVELDWIELQGTRVTVIIPSGDRELGLEILARAERAAGLVSGRFDWTPSERIRLVVNDSSDSPNGFALPFPYPQTQIFVTAPQEDDFLASYDDWLDILVRHELTHVHHLDRADGWAKIPRYLFGKAPGFGSPGSLVPIFLIEGLAVWQESHPEIPAKERRGRVYDAASRGLLRVAASAGKLPEPDEVSVLGIPYPGGLGPYLVGASFLDFYARSCPEGALNEVVRKHSGKLIPFLIQQTLSDACGKPFYDLWDGWKRSLTDEAATLAANRKAAPEPSVRIEGGIGAIRWTRQGIVFRGADAEHGLKTFLLNSETGIERDWDDVKDRKPLRRRSPVEPPSEGGIWVTEGAAEARPGVRFNQLEIWRNGERDEFKGGLRAFDADVHPSGSLWAFVRNRPPYTELAVGNGTDEPQIIRPVEKGVVWSSPRFSPGGKQLVAARRERGEVRIVILDSGQGYSETIRGGFSGARNITPRYLADGRIVFASDVSGVFNLYIWSPASGEILQLTDSIGGAFDPAPSPDGIRIAYRELLPDGQGVVIAEVSTAWPVTPKAETAPAPSDAAPAPETPAPVNTTGSVAAEERPYSPWPMYLPRFWIPLWAQSSNDFLLGAFTGGQDVLRRGFWSASVYWGLNSNAPRVFATAGAHRLPVWGRPLPYVQVSRNLVSFGRGEVSRIGPAGTGIPEVRDFWNDRFRVSAGITTSDALTVAQLPYLEDLRQGFAASLAVFYERRRDLDGGLTALAAKIPGLSPNEFRALDLVGSRLVLDYSNLKYATNTLGPRLGINLSGAIEGYLKEAGSDRTGANLSGDARLYLPVPVIPRQTIALRSSAGTTLKRRIMVPTYTLGGAIGEGPAVLSSGRIPLLRGYPDSRFSGDNYLAFNSEYRINLLNIHRGPLLLPLHLDRVGLVGFFDAGQVWNDAFSGSNFMKGAGGELWLDGRLFYYLPARLRTSVARGFDAGAGTEVRVVLGSTF